MKTKIPCEVIEDILPSYIDGITNEVTNEMIKEHTSECTHCSELLEMMKCEENVPIGDSDLREIDFLKKTHKRNRIVMISSIITAIILIAVILAGKTYYFGHHIAGDAVDCELEVDGRQLTIKAAVQDDMTGLSNVKYSEEDGTVTLSFQAVRASVIYDNELESSFSSDNDIKQVRIDSRIIWAEGQTISKYTSDVFNSGHPYIGSMPDNADSAGALNMSANIGDFTNELQTTDEPYGWKMILETPFNKDEESQKLEIMKSYAYALLAVIDNLGEISYDYRVDGDASVKDDVHAIKFTTDEATSWIGYDIKECGRDIVKLQEMLKKCGLEAKGIEENKNEDLMEVEFTDIHYPDANTRASYDSIHNVCKAQSISTGKGIKVGILDWCFGFHSGCNLYTDGIDFMTFDDHAENFDHERGHGYWMATTLHEIAPDVQIYAIGTFSPEGEKQWVDSLIKGIDWAIENDIDILTLSHAMISEENRERFDEAVGRAHAKGIVTTFIHYDDPDNILPWGIWKDNDPDYNREPDINIFQYDYNTVFLDSYQKIYKDITFADRYKKELNLSVSSMSVVTGGFVAMMMEKDDSLSASEYRDILVKTSKPMEYEGDKAEHVVDIYAALESMK